MHDCPPVVARIADFDYSFCSAPYLVNFFPDSGLAWKVYTYMTPEVIGSPPAN